MAKKNFHELVPHVPEGEIDAEIREKLDAIVEVAESADGEAVSKSLRRCAHQGGRLR